MAEAFAKLRFKDFATITSAGTFAHGINPNAIQTMHQIGIDITAQSSDVVTTEMLSNSNLVITLCGDALDSCPVLPPHTKHQHWHLQDPAKFKGSDEETERQFGRIRDQIKDHVDQLAKSLIESSL
jgi:arsenate reductase